MLRFGLLVAVGLFSGTALAAPPSIQWVRFDFPPFEINGGPLENRGLVDGERRSAQQALPGYRHIDAGPVNEYRLVKLFDAGNYCHGGLIRMPLYEQHAYLSYITSIMPNKTLITTRRIFQQKLSGRRDLSFRQVLAMPDLLMGHSTQALGLELQPVFDAYAKPQQVYFRKGIDHAGLFQMLARQRIDYLIAFPAEAAYWKRLHPEYDLVAVPLTETRGTFAQGRVACSKNDWGRAVIHELNQQILRYRLSSSHLKASTLPWVAPEDRPQYLLDFQRIVGADHWSNAE